VTATRRDELIGSRVEVLVDAPGVGRTYREAPEIDGIVTLPADLEVGSFVEVEVVGALGPDLIAEPVAVGAPS
jgi:ribosomal protein S12 methylthiotransferase